MLKYTFLGINNILEKFEKKSKNKSSKKIVRQKTLYEIFFDDAEFGYPGMSISGAPGGGGMDRSASRNTETTSSNTEILIVGGLGHSFDQKIQEGRPLDTCESLIITDNGPKRSWSSIQNLDIGRASASFVKCGKYYYLIGGLSYTAGSDPKDQDKNGPSSRVDKIKLC